MGTPKKAGKILRYSLKLLFLLIILLAGNHANAAGAGLLNESIIDAERLGLRMEETTANGLVEETFRFHMPYFEPGKDAVITEPVNLYFGSYGKPHPYREGFMQVESIRFNGRSLGYGLGNSGEGWKRIRYADSSENLLISVPYGDFNFGEANEFVVRFRPAYPGTPEGAYYENLGLAVGRFFSVINVTHGTALLSNNTFSTTFVLKNMGMAGETGPIAFYLFFRDATSPSEVRGIAFVDSALDEKATSVVTETVRVENLASYFTLSTSYLRFGDSGELNVTVIATVNETGAGPIPVRPAYSYNYGPIIFLEEANLSIGNWCIDDSGCREPDVCFRNLCERPKIRIIYVPVNWESRYGPFQDIAARHHRAFLDSIPSLANCSGLVKMDVLNASLVIPMENLSASNNLMALYIMTAICTSRTFDFAVGLAPPSSFSGNSVGYTIKSMPAMLERFDAYYATPHEMGHQFGLKDEYCSCPGLGLCDEEPNPLEARLGCDTEGNCCWEDERILSFELENRCDLGSYERAGCRKCCMGNLNSFGGRSIMSWANAGGPRAHDEVSLRHLESIENLRCDE
ncbi:MAG: hypothetical protein AB1657_01115 [Candidatus Micrarchaeota archaeon]